MTMDEIMSTLREGEFEHLTDDDIMGLLVCALPIMDMAETPDEVAPLYSLYETFMERIPGPQRRDLGMVITQSIEKGNASINYLFPFLLMDDYPTVVSTTAINFVMAQTPEKGEDLLAVRQVVELIRQKTLANPAVAFAGLLNMGDRRICKLLWDFRKIVEPDAYDIVTTKSLVMQRWTLEFYLDWLQDALDRGEDELAGSLTAALVNAKKNATIDTVMESERLLSRRDLSKCGVRQLNMIPFEEFVAMHQSRLWHMLQTERGEEKIMPFLFEAWGLSTS
ncbi:hypothetical protein CVU37_06610 [candidate division BRC1 bacterium HGW-BRC1-1]|nr:MAG: hypothetical protein CVU37_06610 [candidate division BRC1 bacterium HGW-BRC1-1]